MREFANVTSRANALPPPAKALYTAFAVFTMAGLLGSAFLYADMLGGVGTDEVVAYYRGAPVPAPTATPGAATAATATAGDTAAGGPALDLELDDPAGAAGEAGSAVPIERIVVVAPYRKLLEVTHFHLFSMPVLLLIAGHLYLLVGASARAKTAWITAATAGTALHVAAPWCVRWAGGALAWLYPVSGAILLGSLGWMLTHAVWDMWVPRSSRSASPPSS